MGAVQTLTSAIKTRVQTVLTNAYSEIGFANDVAKNPFKGATKCFGVLPKGGSESASLIGYLSFNQSFELILTDSFINTQLSDGQEQQVSIALQDLAFSVFKDLVTSKCGSPATCLNVGDFSLSDPEKNEKVVIQRATFTVKYRQKL